MLPRLCRLRSAVRAVPTGFVGSPSFSQFSRGGIGVARFSSGTSGSSLFTETHEWVRPAKEHEKHVVVGITNHAQEMLGEAWWLELPAVGETFKRNEVMAMIEGMKHPPKSQESEDAPAVDDEVDEVEDAFLRPYKHKGWDVQEVTLGKMGNMRTVQRQVFAPADCVVVEVNTLLGDRTELLNTSAEKEGWLLRVELTEEAPSLLDASGYADHCSAELASE